MSLVMKEWYGISTHFAIIFCLGVATGWYISGGDEAAVTASLNQIKAVQGEQQPVLVSDNDSYQFMQNWCAANFGKKGE
ncbi:MAG: hypothetical protein JG718_09615 [Candidatus Thiothrix moscowensis]|nr:hypothetical protein [Candidatus Thiothrix moscowensis]